METITMAELVTKGVTNLTSILTTIFSWAMANEFIGYFIGIGVGLLAVGIVRSIIRNRG